MRPQRTCHQPHGTVTRYVAGCSCIECCDAHRLYQAEHRVGRRYVASMVDPRPTRRRILALLTSMGVCEIAKRAGVRRETVRAIRDGKFRSVKRATADAILGVTNKPRQVAA